jgi:hypothetical protein
MLAESILKQWKVASYFAKNADLPTHDQGTLNRILA